MALVLVLVLVVVELVLAVRGVVWRGAVVVWCCGAGTHRTRSVQDGTRCLALVSYVSVPTSNLYLHVQGGVWWVWFGVVGGGWCGGVVSSVWWVWRSVQ